jgi:hypothetical protein
VAASMASPAAQGIQVTRDITLDFWIYYILCRVWFLCKFKKYFVPLSFKEVKEYN